MCPILLIQCLDGCAPYETLYQFWKQNQPKTNLAPPFSSVTIFKPENVTALLWDATKIKHCSEEKNKGAKNKQERELLQSVLTGHGTTG